MISNRRRLRWPSASSRQSLLQTRTEKSLATRYCRIPSKMSGRVSPSDSVVGNAFRNSCVYRLLACPKLCTSFAERVNSGDWTSERGRERKLDCAQFCALHQSRAAPTSVSVLVSGWLCSWVRPSARSRAMETHGWRMNTGDFRCPAFWCVRLQNALPGF